MEQHLLLLWQTDQTEGSGPSVRRSAWSVLRSRRYMHRSGCICGWIQLDYESKKKRRGRSLGTVSPEHVSKTEHKQFDCGEDLFVLTALCHMAK